MTVQQNCIKGRSLGRGRSLGDAIPSASLWSKAVSHRLVAWKVARTARVALRLTAGVTFSVQKGLWRGLRQGGQAIFLRKIWKKAFPSFAFSESPTSTHIQLLITSLTTKLTVQKVQAIVYCPRISKSRGPAISWGYSPSLLKISCGVQSTTEKIEKSTARAELLPQPTDVKRVGGTGEPKSELHECFTSKQP